MDVSGLIGRQVDALFADRSVRFRGRIVGGYVRGGDYGQPTLIVERSDGGLDEAHLGSVSLVPAPDLSQITKRADLGFCGHCRAEVPGWDLQSSFVHGETMQICGACRIGLCNV